MSDCFKIISSTQDYSVQIGNDLLKSLKYENISGGVIVICDDFFSSIFKSQGMNVISICADESAKNLDQMSSIIVALREFEANRNTMLLAVGGGVIQDIATFVASIYMRGIKWEYWPTTLLGMVDSCIGGKSSINVGKLKNLVGNFYPPEMIQIDLQFITTLNTAQRVAGLFEAVKICFASTQTAFDQYILLSPSVDNSCLEYKEAISLSLQTKRWFIEIDEYDKKERLLLNFGHTFGHAIEGATNFAVPHGIAVGMGMLVAIDCARALGYFTNTTPKRVSQLRNYSLDLLSKVSELPIWSSQIVYHDLMTCFDSDKKHTNDHYVIILPTETGHLTRLNLKKNDISREMIFNALNSVCQICCVPINVGDTLDVV